MQKNFCVLLLLCSALYNISCNAKKVEKKLAAITTLAHPVDTVRFEEAESISFAAYHRAGNLLKNFPAR